jgi:hypothetical protein
MLFKMRISELITGTLLFGDSTNAPPWNEEESVATDVVSENAKEICSSRKILSPLAESSKC